MRDIEHKGLKCLAAMDINNLVKMHDEQRVIDIIEKLISGKAETEDGFNRIIRELPPFSLIFRK